MLSLVKDFDDYQIVFYWVDETNAKASPDLPTLNHAREWFVTHGFSKHEGTERRKRTCDRRHSESDRPPGISKRRNPDGRRQTDKPIKVDIDLSLQKLSSLKDVV